MMETKNSYDYGDDAKLTTPVSQDALARLTRLAHDLRDAQAHQDELERQAKDNQKKIDALSEVTIPELMEAMGMKEFVTAEGIRVSIDNKIRVHIPKARIPEAVNWLDENGYGKLVDREFVIKFGREDEDWANKFQRDLAQRKRPVDSTVKQSIHHARLNSWAKGVMEAGVILPENLFSQFNQRFTKVVVGK